MVELSAIWGIKKICEYVANGGSLITYCETNKGNYAKIINKIYENDTTKEIYEQALEARGEFVAQRLLRELDRIGFSDARKLFNDDGSVKEVSELDDATAACIAGIDIQDAKFDKDGDEVTPRTRKIKLADNLKALEMLGKHLKMFTDKHEVSGALSLESLVTGSMASTPTDEPKTTESPSEPAPEVKEPTPKEESKDGEGQEQPKKDEENKADDGI